MEAPDILVQTKNSPCPCPILHAETRMRDSPTIESPPRYQYPSITDLTHSRFDLPADLAKKVVAGFAGSALSFSISMRAMPG